MSTKEIDDYEQLRNRLLSIFYDRHYIENEVLQGFSLMDIVPVPNARCGNWYTANEENLESYFKSTDGHKDHWGFNYRRLNLHILEKILEWNKDKKLMMIVDSSKYRQIPDSLSKTVPIWCCILSLFMNKESFTENGIINIQRFNKMTNYLLELPVQMENVKQEADQICEKMIHLYESACEYLPDFYGKLRSMVNKYYEPIAGAEYIKINPTWIYPGYTGATEDIRKEVDIFDGHKVQIFNLLLCSTSSYSRISRHHGNEKYQRSKTHNKFKFDFNYYQGAGDDHEMWGMKLINPKIFNDNKEKFEILLKNEELENVQLVSLLDSLAHLDHSEQNKKTDVYGIDDLGKVFIANNTKITQQIAEEYGITIVFGKRSIKDSDKVYVFDNMTDDKKGIRMFFKNIKRIEKILSSNKSEDSVLFSSEKFDLNIACSLIYLIKYNNLEEFDKSQWSKMDIRQLYLKMLERINVETKTSRLVLNNVNSYIIS
ncbi:tRNA A64-2'-O-ribosylphosphate transferase [Hanseniaspora uvarum]|nr:tRNA A64-2'-O-ribosylphosphate transferase [Hanseniaspora uvarum]